MLKAKFWTIPTTLAVCVLFSGGVQGATITVTKVEDILNDQVCCSLRDAIAVAASGDTVTFRCGLVYEATHNNFDGRRNLYQQKSHYCGRWRSPHQRK